MAPSAESKKKKTEEDLKALKATVETTMTLITQLSASASSSTSSSTSHDGVNALDLAHDSASLIRAHSTKLSLLIINKPFTATAISTVLRELVAGPLPGLASAVELCTGSRYTKAMSAELQFHANRVFRELAVLVKVIPLDGNILTDDARNGTGNTEGNGSLASTGVVWGACDGVIELKKIGVAGLLVRQAEDYRELIEDALWEIQDWGKDGSEADEDEYEGSEDEDDAQAVMDNLFTPQRHIPTADPEQIRPLFDSSVKRLRLVLLMYQAVVKRRLKPFPRLPLSEDGSEGKGQGIVAKADKVIDVLKSIPEIVDELATAFYSLDKAEIEKRMGECFTTTFAAAKLLIENWNGQEDEFSKWAVKLEPLLIGTEQAAKKDSS